ncbi:MAG: 50S ribosomal protein L1 [Planctomycetes bacterium]|nr:50S ribosomal protein L1 [Planctomycetota bacterium]
MKKRSRRYRSAREGLGVKQRFELKAAVEKLKAFPPGKFDESVDLALNLGIDPKKSDQMVRGSFAFPHGIGKSKRVIVFAEGQRAEEALAAGAIKVGTDDLAKEIEKGWFEFDVVIATPDQMRSVGKLGKVLGPKGLMPTPKTGTVTQDVRQTVRDFVGGKVEFKVDKESNLHLPVGRRSFPPEKLVENIQAFLDHLATLRPTTAKGDFVRRATLSATMSPGVELALER